MPGEKPNPPSADAVQASVTGVPCGETVWPPTFHQRRVHLDREAALLVRLRESAPSWERAVFHYAGEPQLGGHRARRLLLLLAPLERPTERSCRGCGYRWTVKPDPGQNVLPQSCPMCHGAMRWKAADEPETYVALAPGSGVSPQELVGWAVDFKRCLDLQATRAIPDPEMLVRFWVWGHEEGQPPSYRYLAMALKNHLGLPKRPHPQVVWRAWRGMSVKYELGH